MLESLKSLLEITTQYGVSSVLSITLAFGWWKDRTALEARLILRNKTHLDDVKEILPALVLSSKAMVDLQKVVDGLIAELRSRK